MLKTLGLISKLYDGTINLSPLILLNKKNERGEATVIVTAIVLILIITAATIFNRIYSFQRMGQLQSIANSLVRYGGTFLPNPLETMTQTSELWRVLKLQHESGAEIKYFFDSAAGDKIEIELSKHPIDNSRLALPIKSFTVLLTESFSIPFMNIWNLTPFSVSAEATVHLMPSDIVIVVENSNSLLSKTELEIQNGYASENDTIFGAIENWGSVYYP